MRCIVYSILVIFLLTNLAGALTGEVPGNGGLDKTPYLAASLEPKVDGEMVDQRSRAPTAFTENRGQVEEHVRFYEQGGGVWFTDDGVWFDIRDEDEGKGVVLKQEFVGCNDVEPEGVEYAGWNSNFFYGNDPEEWRSDVPNWDEVWYRGLWDGIDLRYYTNGDGLKYDLIIHPGAIIDDIEVRYVGAGGIYRHGHAEIRIDTEIGDIWDGGLFIYQEIDGRVEEVEGCFQVCGDDAYRFRISESYDADRLLIIDPELDYSTYVGASGQEYCNDIDTTPSGNAIITGNTGSASFPTTPGAYDNTIAGSSDMFLTSLNPTGTGLAYSTFIGGTSGDNANAIAVDSAGCAYLTGRTSSSDFPITSGAFSATMNGSYDAFVVKLNAAGSALVYSTYLGGSSTEEGMEIAVDSSGCAYVTGDASSGFPTTNGAYDVICAGSDDIFVTKFNSAGSALVYSTFVGGNGYEDGESIDVDSMGAAYVTGETSASNFPTTVGAPDSTLGGSYDAVAFKLNPAGSALVYSTYIGGSSSETGLVIAVDNSGCAYCGGKTGSSDFPITSGSFDNSQNGAYDAYVVKIAANGGSYTYGTFIGGNSNDDPFNIDVDSSGRAYMTGETYSTNFPTTQDALIGTTSGGSNSAYLVVLEPDGSQLNYSTYLEGNIETMGHGVAIDDTGDVYLTGTTRSTNYPTTPGAYQRTNAGSYECYVTKFRIVRKMAVKSFDVIFDDLSTEEVYSRRGVYTLRVDLDTAGALTDVTTLRTVMDPGGENIQLIWNRATSEFSKLNDPDDRVTLMESSLAENDSSSRWTVDYHVTFDWSYGTEGPNDIQILASSDSVAPAWLNETGFFTFENDLDFTGALRVLGSDDRVLAEDDMVSGGETLNCTGLSVVYQGTTDVYPPPEEYDISVWGETGEPFYDSTGEGGEMGLDITAPWESYDSGYTYTFNISGIPPECDATDMTFTLGVDGDNVTFTDPYPDDATWQTDSMVDVGVTITDWGGGLVDGDSIGVRYSVDNGETWSGWADVPSSSSASIEPGVTLPLEDGTGNLVQWQASDTIGNGPAMSPEYPVMVDSGGVEFESPVPYTNYISSTESVITGINITDAVSGVDASTIEYSISFNGGISWDDWTVVMGYEDGPLVQAGVTAEFVNGADNLIRWRAWDIAGNGPMESDEYPVLVDLCMAYSIDTALVTPADEAVLTISSAELSWALVDVDNPCGSVVEYDVYLDTVNPPMTPLKSGYMDTSVSIDNLKDKMIYYWTVTPVRESQVGTCISGVWSFTYDSEAYVPEVALISPTDGSTLNTDSIQLAWEPLDEGGGDGWSYDIILDTVNPPSLARFTDLTDTSAVFIDMVDKVTYYWTVSPCNGTFTGACSSGVWSFTYDSDAVVPEVTLVSPADGETLSEDSVRLEWAPVGGGAGWKYEIYLDESDPPSTLRNGGYTLTSVTIGGLEDGGTYYWTVVPISAEGVYGVFGATVWSFTVDMGGDAQMYGLDIADISAMAMSQGDVLSLEVNITNTGVATDSFVFEVSSDTLDVRLQERSTGEITLSPDDTAPIYLTLTVGQDAMLGAHSVTVRGTSMVAGDAGLLVHDNVTFTVNVYKRSDQGAEPEGGSDGDITLYLVLVAVIVAVVIVLLLVLRKRKKGEDGYGAEVPEGTAIAVDIVKPGMQRSPKTLMATPAVVDVTPEGFGPVPTHTPLAPAPVHPPSAGGSTPIRTTAPLSGAPAGPGAMPADRLLPKAPAETGADAVVTPPLVTKPAPTDPSGAKIIAPRDPPDRAEVYHQDSGATWTPDMATERTVKESASAMDMLPKLKKMLDERVITQEEYEVSKKRLLRKI